MILALVNDAHVVGKLTILPAMSCKALISVLFASVRMATPYDSVSSLFCHLIIDAIGVTPYCSYHREPVLITLAACCKDMFVLLAT